MKFRLYTNNWAGGSPNGKDVCEKHGVKGHQDSDGSHFVFLLPKDLMALASDSEIDVLITGSSSPQMLAFDKAGKRFSQR